jgi:hypothetical protein
MSDLSPQCAPTRKSANAYGMRQPGFWRHSLRKRTALAAEIPNGSAAARRDMPPSTASMILIRKSSDKGFAMRAGLLASAQVNKICRLMGIPIDSIR